MDTFMTYCRHIGDYGLEYIFVDQSDNLVKKHTRTDGIVPPLDLTGQPLTNCGTGWKVISSSQLNSIVGTIIGSL